MKKIKIKDENNNNVEVSVLGFFNIPDLEKEYIMYSLIDDNPNNENGLVLIGEIERTNDNIIVNGIEEDEKKLVIEYYKEISNQMGESK